MACNTCAKSFTLFRKEKGCPGCGFSYCSKCLFNEVYLKKCNSTVKVCVKCKQGLSKQDTNIEPPEAYFKRLNATDQRDQQNSVDKHNAIVQQSKTKDQEILERLKKLKEDRIAGVSEDEIAKRLNKFKGEVCSTSSIDLETRLAKLKGLPTHSSLVNKTTLPAPESRTEQEQADDMIKQYLEQTKIDQQYDDDFNSVVKDIESRLKMLKGENASTNQNTDDSDDEEELVKKVIEKYKAQTTLEIEDTSTSTSDELPFCEICNEDANVRCLGCHYLFCKRCFNDHKDDDDGCNKYEPYKPLKTSD